MSIQHCYARTTPHSSKLTATLAGAVTFGLPALLPAAPAVFDNDIFLDSWNGDGNPTSQDFHVSVDGDAVSEFKFSHQTNPDAHTTVPTAKYDINGVLTLNPGQTAQFLAIVKDTDGAASGPSTANTIEDFAEVLTVGTIVGPGSTFIDLSSASYDNRLLDSSGLPDTDDGAFSVEGGELTNTIGVFYIGFAFGDMNNPNYGYFEFDFIENDNGELPFIDYDGAAAQISGWAYETTPGTPITIVPIPEPSSLALVGLSSLALLRRRRVG